MMFFAVLQSPCRKEVIKLNRTPVVSSNIRSIGYESGTLEVEFKDGSVYQYDNVPPSVHSGLMSAPSHGEYMDRHVKKAGFKYRKVR